MEMRIMTKSTARNGNHSGALPDWWLDHNGWSHHNTNLAHSLLDTSDAFFPKVLPH
jgi:phosphoketolase